MQIKETESLGIGLSEKGGSYRSIQCSLIAINKLSSDTSHSHSEHDLKQTEMNNRFNPLIDKQEKTGR